MYTSAVKTWINNHFWTTPHAKCAIEGIWNEGFLENQKGRPGLMGLKAIESGSPTCVLYLECRHLYFSVFLSLPEYDNRIVKFSNRRSSSFCNFCHLLVGWWWWWGAGGNFGQCLLICWFLGVIRSQSYIYICIYVCVICVYVHRMQKAKTRTSWNWNTNETITKQDATAGRSFVIREKQRRPIQPENNGAEIRHF